MNLTLNIYDKSGKEVVKVLKSSTYDLMFTTIRKIMAILKVESLDNNVEILKIICEAWDEVVDVLSAVFPDAEESDWDGVKVKELVPVVMDIAKFAITDALTIPSKNSKN